MAEWNANWISVFGYRIIETNWTVGRTNSNDSLVIVQVVSSLLYSFSWLKLKHVPYTIQCSVQKSSEEYTCFSSFKSEAKKGNLLLYSQNHSHKHFS